jgi:hypothetical protein
MTVEDRRREPRYDLAVPIRVDGVKYGLAVTHNASQNGLLVVLASAVDIGTAITLTFQGAGASQKPLRATVVRSDRNVDDPGGLWPFRVGLHLDEPIEDLETLRALHRL